MYKQRIREIREDRDLTIRDIAKAIGIKNPQYSRYETGKNELPIRYLIKLCLYYGISADYILGLPKGLKWER